MFEIQPAQLMQTLIDFVNKSHKLSTKFSWVDENFAVKELLHFIHINSTSFRKDDVEKMFIGCVALMHIIKKSPRDPEEIFLDVKDDLGCELPFCKFMIEQNSKRIEYDQLRMESIEADNKYYKAYKAICFDFMNKLSPSASAEMKKICINEAMSSKKKYQTLLAKYSPYIDESEDHQYSILKNNLENTNIFIKSLENGEEYSMEYS